MREKIDQFISLWPDIEAEARRITSCISRVRFGSDCVHFEGFEVEDGQAFVRTSLDGPYQSVENYYWKIPKCYFGADGLAIEKREVEVKQTEEKRLQKKKEREQFEREHEAREERRDQYYRLKEEFAWEEHRVR